MEKAFRKNLDKNSRIKDLQKKLKAGKLTGNEADLYAVEVGTALAKAFHDNVNGDVLPDGRMYYNIASRVIPPPLISCYEDVADYAQAMYKGLNEQAGIGIKAQRAKFSEDRVSGLVEYVCGAEKYEDRQKDFEGSLVNFSQSVATETMKENAEFQYQAGLSPVIRRTANSGCCKWCAGLVGVYPYEDVRATGSKVYRRHRDCRCQVVYDPGDGKVQNVHTKRWERRPLDAPLRGDNAGSKLRGKALEKKIDSESRKVYDNSPAEKGVMELPVPLKFEYKEDKGYIPAHAVIEEPTTIAGKGTNSILRDTPRLVAQYNRRADRWEKRVGKVYSDKYVFDIHWYENDGEVFEHKIKHVKERKK